LGGSETILCVDTEQTTWTKGNPFDQRNFNVCISYWNEDTSGVVFAEDRGQLEPLYKGADLIVGFNLKYDLHWLRKIYNFVPERIWDVQLCEFLLGRQSPAYPDLDSTAKKYTGQGKSTAVEEYWNAGLNTHEIPRHVLAEYALLDSELTYKCYLRQRELLPSHQIRLFSLMCQDLLVLQEMEWNGLQIDEELAEQKALELEAKISQIQSELDLYHNVPGFNWASNDHLSALLYGGTIVRTEKEPDGFFKSGAKVGQVKFKKVLKYYHLPRIYKPIRNSALQKEGIWSVEESYLRKLKGDNSLIQGILEIKEMGKLISTYLRGFPKKRRESSWLPGMIHSTLNQCVASTGRLTSTRPNGQNIPFETIGDIFISRYN
jgi:DNA polymerase I-like protein with 3'-5' exonuclease and polymerase domains